MSNHLLTYEEDKQLTEIINAILSEKTNTVSKIKELRHLRLNVSSSLGLSHIDYYLNQLQSNILSFVGHLISFILVLLYLIFTLFRVYWLYHPGENPLPSTGITITDLIIAFYYAGTAALAIYVIYRLMRRLLHKK